MIKTGDDYFDSKEFHELLATYEESVSTRQPVLLDADELADIADYYHMMDKLEEADAAINLALSLSPGSIAPLTFKINEALADNDIALAEQYFSQITDTDDPDYLYDQVEIMLAKEQYDEAETLLRDQIDCVPTDEFEDYVLDVAGIYLKYELSDKALEWIKLAKDVNDPAYKELLGRIFFSLGRYQESEKLYDELIDDNPFSKRYWHGLTTSQLMNEDYANAVQSSEYAIALDPEDPDGMVFKADGLFELENYEQALEYYDRFLKIVPDNLRAIIRSAICLINMKRVDEGIQRLLKAKEIPTEDRQAAFLLYQELAFAYSDKARSDKELISLSIEYLEQAKPYTDDQSEIDISKGHIYLAHEMTDEAEIHFREAIRTSNDQRLTLLRVIISLYDNHYLKSAHDLFLKYFDVYGEVTDEGYAYMALCCYDLHLHKEFLAYLKEASQRNPRECKLILGFLFPDDLEPKDYYHHYIKNNT